MTKTINNQTLFSFTHFLKENEKSARTVEKYIRDIRHFLKFLSDREPDRSLLLSYKSILKEEYAVTSANSKIAAINSFFRFLKRDELILKQFKVQRKIFCSSERELTKAEYFRLVNAAKNTGNRRLNLLMQTVCSTGIRISELPFITVEAVENLEAQVSLKGKNRVIFISPALQKKLKQYIRDENIKSGPVFITKNGNPMNRSNIWREMKKLCALAGVSENKVFPHNLRHLFARIFYGIEKDIIKLADILGHSNINTTRIYIMSSGEEHRKRIETMKLVI